MSFMTKTRVNTALDALNDVVANKDGGEDRPQQRTMVEAVCRSVETAHPVMIEAGTGSGKSFAELIPAAIYSDMENRWVVSTATIQLSEQIGELDLPFLETRIKGLRDSWAVLKGRSNYACLENIDKVEREDQEAQKNVNLFDDDTENGDKKELPKESKELQEILEWSKTTDTGSRTDAPAVSDRTWSRVSRSSGTCPGAEKCIFGSSCFAEKAIRNAKESRIVITNHALVAHDLSKRAQDGEGVFGPGLTNIVFDESHQLESYLSEAWGAEFSEEFLKEFLSQVKSIIGSSSKDTQNSLKEHGEDIVRAAVVACKADDKSFLVSAKDGFPSLVQSALNVFERDVKDASRLVLHDEKAKSSMSKLTQMMLDTLHLFQTNDEGTVRWIEYDSMEWKKGAAPTASLRTAPLMIGEQLTERTNDVGINTIFTSATIKVDGGFSIPSLKLGVDAADGVDLGSPFNFRTQGILCIPDIPSPKADTRDDHFREFKKMSLKVVKALNGRTLILCTSKKNTVAMREFLEKKGINVVDTVDTPQAQATRMFKNDTSCVLVGTYGVWQGLDVPGESLQAVLIEKIPFNRMDDMLAKARSDYWDRHGKSGFMLESIASAQTRLNQAVGRLIRARSDRGIVIIADPRMKTTRYGKALVSGLPGFYRMDDFDKVVASCKNLKVKK